MYFYEHVTDYYIGVKGQAGTERWNDDDYFEKMLRLSYV